MRRNRANTGKPWEKAIESALAYYEAHRFLKAAKVDPPTRISGGRVIFLANPFLDYVGAWTEQGGRAVMFEAKSTAGDRLPVNRDGGLTRKQVVALWTWYSAGAVAFVLWNAGGKWLLIPAEQVMRQKEASIHADAALPVPMHALGFPDFLNAMRRLLPPSSDR